MGTATDTVPCNNLTQISTNECRVSIYHFIFSLFVNIVGFVFVQSRRERILDILQVFSIGKEKLCLQ